MTWNSLRLPAAVALVASALVLHIQSHSTVLARTASSTVQVIPHTAQQLAPLAPYTAKPSATPHTAKKSRDDDDE